MTSSRKTRNETSTLMSEYLGKGKEMLQTELPTLRDCLRYGILLKETDPAFSNKFTPTSVLAKAILIEIKQRWQRANFKFQPPVIVQDKVVLDKLTAMWDKAYKISCKKVTSQPDISRLETQLDKLLDMTKCRCPMFDCDADEVKCTGCHCQEEGCTGCPKYVSQLPPCHVVCTCLAKQRIPLMELPFIRAQREKVGSKSGAMIVNVDEKEHKKQMEIAKKKLEREQKKQRKDEKVLKQQEEAEEGAARVAQFLRGTPNEQDEGDRQAEDGDIPVGDTADQTDDTPDMENNLWVPDISKKNRSKRNMSNIRNVAMASIRFGVSANATAAVANATLLDHGIINKEDTTQVIDAMKVQRAKDLLQTELQEKAAIRYQEESIICILFDGRKDWTRMYVEVEGSTQIYPSIQKEEHYSVVSEPGGQYLFHFTPPPADKDHKAAEQLAIELVNWMKKYGWTRHCSSLVGTAPMSTVASGVGLSSMWRSC
jgi:hypothetical protein